MFNRFQILNPAICKEYNWTALTHFQTIQNSSYPYWAHPILFLMWLLLWPRVRDLQAAEVSWDRSNCCKIHNSSFFSSRPGPHRMEHPVHIVQPIANCFPTWNIPCQACFLPGVIWVRNCLCLVSWKGKCYGSVPKRWMYSNGEHLG